MEKPEPSLETKYFADILKGSNRRAIVQDYTSSFFQGIVMSLLSWHIEENDIGNPEKVFETLIQTFEQRVYDHIDSTMCYRRLMMDTELGETLKNNKMFRETNKVEKELKESLQESIGNVKALWKSLKE